MIIVNLKGGLGNQMFQYACGRGLAARNGDGDFKIDASGLSRANAVGDIYRPFSLERFAITADVIRTDVRTLWQKIWLKIEKKVLRKFYVGFDASILSRKGDVYLDGFFQDERYFADYADSIRREFTLKELTPAVKTLQEEIDANDTAIAIHVRRGDYVNHPDFGGIANVDHFNRAVAHIKNSLPNTSFYIFSDDIEWCKNELHFGESKVHFISNPSLHDYEELWLISRAKHQIISNSSFSWWAAWLNPNPNKIVIAPQRWANGDAEKSFKDIVPAAWVRI